MFGFHFLERGFRGMERGWSGRQEGEVLVVIIRRKDEYSMSVHNHTHAETHAQM